MFNYLSPNTIANEIEMTIKTGKTVIILEGDSDKRCLTKFFNRENVEIISVEGKDNALDTIKILNEDIRIKGFLCIVDSDFDQIIGCDSHSNLIRSEFHDFEITILSSNAFERVIGEYCTKIPNESIRNCDELRSHIFMKMLPISILKLLNYINKWGLCFKGIDLSLVIDKENLNINFNNYLRRVIENTKRSLDVKIGNATESEQIKRFQAIKNEIKQDQFYHDEVRSILENEYQLEQLSNGHDSIAVFSVGLKKMFSSVESKVAEKTNIEKVLRLSYDTRDFVNSKIYNEIKEWEVTNSSVLSC